MIISRSIHVATKGIISFFFMAEEYSIVYMYLIFFIHSSIDVHLGCFHVLATVNNNPMNLFELQFYLGVCPGVELLDHMAPLLLVFEEPTYCSP